MASDSEEDHPILASSDRLLSLWAKKAQASTKLLPPTTSSPSSSPSTAAPAAPAPPPGQEQGNIPDPPPKPHSSLPSPHNQRPHPSENSTLPKQDARTKRRRQYDETDDSLPMGAGIGMGVEGMGSREDRETKRLMERMGVAGAGKKRGGGRFGAAQRKGGTAKKMKGDESSEEEEGEGRSGLGKRKRGR